MVRMVHHLFNPTFQIWCLFVIARFPSKLDVGIEMPQVMRHFNLDLRKTVRDTMCQAFNARPLDKICSCLPALGFCHGLNPSFTIAERPISPVYPRRGDE